MKCCFCVSFLDKGIDFFLGLFEQFFKKPASIYLEDVSS